VTLKRRRPATRWDPIEDLLSEVEGRGRPYADHQMVINGLFWILRAGAPWRDLPDRYGDWETVYTRLRAWTAHGPGPRTGPSIGFLIASRRTSISKTRSTGSSWVHMAQRSRPAGPPLEAQPTIKRGSTPARRGGRGGSPEPYSRLWARRILFENPPCDRRARPSARRGNQRRTASRIGVLYRGDG
jgi:transposase